MSNFTLDDIRAAADKKYGPTVITVHGEDVRLRNPLRLPKDQRKALIENQERASEEDSDEYEVLASSIRIVAENSHQAELLLSDVGDDLGLLAAIFDAYNEEQDTGEASASAA